VDVVSSLPASVTEVVHDGTTYYIVGTAHVSQRSVDEVRAVIAQLEPDLVCIELDKARYEALTKDSAFRNLDVFKVVREGKGLYLLGHLALSSYQRRIGATLGVKPGAELLAASEAATARNIPVELIDRDINITLRRTWRNLGEQIEELKEPEALSQMLAKLGNKVPEIKGPLIDERDRYLASKLVEVGAGHRRVVAVVGAAHVPGMVPQIGKDIDRAALDRVPPPSLLWTIIKWMIYGWRWSDKSSIAEIMLAWVLPTSIGAGGLTLLAGGSLASVASALVVAPIAAIHPLLGTGMVVGVVEAWRRKPSVADCERLPDDIQSLKGFWRNPVTRILLIAVASGIGTAVGFWVGVGWVASLL
jgi:pheromone shutdown protein TraB